MTIRLKLLRQKEEQTRKIAELMNMYKVPGYPRYEYQPITTIGASNITSSAAGSNIDPKIQKTMDLFQMFGLIR